MEAMLGNRIGSYRVNWFEVTRYFVIVWGLPLMFLSAMLSTGDTQVPGELVLAVTVAAYVVVLVVAYFRLPRIDVYEDGIRVVKGTFDQSWRWRDLTHFDGTRTTVRLNGVIPLIAYGANHVYAGKEKAFAINVFTARPSLLAEFVTMKLAERDIPTAVAAYKQGTRLHIGGVEINTQGLGTSKRWVDWLDVRDVRYQEGNPFNDYHSTILVDTHSKKRPQKYGNLAPGHAFLILGVLDAVRGTDKFARLQAEHFSTTKRAMRVGWRWVKVAMWVTGIIGVIAAAAFVLFFIQDRVEQGQREALITLVGAQAPLLCDGFDDPDRDLFKRVNKFAVIDAENDWLHQAYHDALDTAQRATSPEDVTAVICLRERRVEVEECLYGDDPSKPGGFSFTMYRYRRDYDVEIVDVESGRKVLSARLRGERPHECPNEADSDDPDIVGALPSVEEFLEWFRSLSGSTA